jgi:hypothetical protein
MKAQTIEQLKKRSTEACVVVRRMRVPLPQEMRQARKPPMWSRQYHARRTRAALLADRGLGQQGQHNRARKNNLRPGVPHMYAGCLFYWQSFPPFSQHVMRSRLSWAEWFALPRMTWYAECTNSHIVCNHQTRC